MPTTMELPIAGKAPETPLPVPSRTARMQNSLPVVASTTAVLERRQREDGTTGGYTLPGWMNKNAG